MCWWMRFQLSTTGFGALQAVATGAVLPLFLTDSESELEELMAVGAQVFSVAVVGVVLPFASAPLA